MKKSVRMMALLPSIGFSFDYFFCTTSTLINNAINRKHRLVSIKLILRDLFWPLFSSISSNAVRYYMRVSAVCVHTVKKYARVRCTVHTNHSHSHVQMLKSQNTKTFNDAHGSPIQCNTIQRGGLLGYFSVQNMLH